MRQKFVAVTGLLLFLPIYCAVASSYSQLVVFGDSLSDNGNANIFSGGAYPGPNYGIDSATGQMVYSDGPNTTPMAAGSGGLWVDQVASKLGVADPQPYLALSGGTNYAFASAQTGTANPQDMGNQLAFYASKHLTGASPTALYAFWGGSNDILNGNNPTQAADNIESYIAGLAKAGAQNFVWLNLPLLGDTPDGMAAGPVVKATLNAASLVFNNEWAVDLAALQGEGIHVAGANIGALFTSLVANPGAYGLTNITSAAQTSGLTTNDAGYLFWDGKHPTTAGHTLIAGTVEASLTPTPEPASAGFAVVGVLTVAGFGFKRRASQLR